MTHFPESCMKKGKWWSAICNYKQLYNNPCISSAKLKQTMKGSLCYNESIYVHFRLIKSILQELQIFFACVYTNKICLQLQWLGKLYVIGFSPTLLYGYKYRTKGITFKYGLNIGRSIYKLLILHLQVQWINKNPCYNRC